MEGLLSTGPLLSSFPQYLPIIVIYFKLVVLLFFHNSNDQRNSPYVEFLWDKIEGNLGTAKTVYAF